VDRIVKVTMTVVASMYQSIPAGSESDSNKVAAAIEWFAARYPVMSQDERNRGIDVPDNGTHVFVAQEIVE
jgi:hypothetical protein